MNGASADRLFLFAGGGTGGHLYPGVAIAEQIRALDPGANVVFICSDKPLDARLLEKQGEAHMAIPARPLSLRPIGLARLCATWGGCVRACRAALGRLRAEGRAAHMVAMGGYVAAPAVQAARAERAPITLVNLDAVPGRANRWIARHAQARFTAADPKGDAFRSWIRVPPIVRLAAVARGTPLECRERLGLAPRTPTLLVTGASQGARSINGMMAALIGRPEVAAALAGWQVYHQTGGAEDEADAMRSSYLRGGIPAVVTPFCDDMASAWGAADVAISRCGAGSVAEVWANRVPTLFMPYPHHRDDHQRKNARPLLEARGAVVETDHVDAGANTRAVGPTLVGLLRDASRRSQMRAAIRALGPANGAERVARALLDGDARQVRAGPC